MKKKIFTLLKIPLNIPSKSGDLVLIINKSKKYEFRQVATTEGHYSSFSSGMSYYVPHGFILLRNINTGESNIECLGTVVGQYNFDITSIVPDILI